MLRHCATQLFYRRVAQEVREGNGTPLQYSCLENPMDGGAWWAAVHGVPKSRTRLSNFHFHFSLSCIGEGNGNPLQCSCLENSRDGGVWWAAVYGVGQSQTRLKWLTVQYSPRSKLICPMSSLVVPGPLSEGAQSSPTLCDPMDCSLQGSSHFPGKNTGVGCHFLFQEIFPSQGLNPGLPHCRQTLYHLSHP